MRIQHRHLVAAGAAAVCVPVTVTAAAVQEPFYIVFATVAAICAVIALAFDRWWAVVPAMLGSLFIFSSLPFVVHALQHPDSVFDFAPAVLGMPAALAVVGFGVAELAGRKRGVRRDAPVALVRGLATGAAVLTLSALVSGVLTVTNRTTVSASDRAGAQVVKYNTSKVDVKTIDTKAGEPIKVVVENHDLYVHDFTVKAANVSVDLGPKDEKLVEFTIATPGEYAFVCTLHDGMKGTIVVR